MSYIALALTFAEADWLSVHTFRFRCFKFYLFFLLMNKVGLM